MRRWLITIFALHFLVSVGLFAPMSAEARALPPAALQMAEVAFGHTDPQPPAPAAQLKTLFAADHSVNEIQPDLPECLPLLKAHPFAVALRLMQPRGDRPGLPSPALKGPQRPPRTPLA